MPLGEMHFLRGSRTARRIGRSGCRTGTIGIAPAAAPHAPSPGVAEGVSALVALLVDTRNIYFHFGPEA